MQVFNEKNRYYVHIKNCQDLDSDAEKHTSKAATRIYGIKVYETNKKT